MKIGLLQCGHTAPSVIAEHGEYAQMFVQLLSAPGQSFEIWDVCDGTFPSATSDADAWLLTGSPHGVYEDLPFIAPLEAFVRDIVKDRRPLAGICFGHQIIATALGGRVIKHPGGWRMGPTEYVIAGEDGPVTLHAWHQDQVVSAPPDAQIIAHAPGCENAGMRIGDHVLTLQPHPEFTDEILASLIAARTGAPGYDPEQLAQTRARLGERPVSRAWVTDRLVRFLDQARARVDV